LRSLHILQEQAESSNLKRALTTISDEVESGSTISEALGNNPRSSKNSM
jgi:type II secretory pathway component PulF